MRVHPIVFSVLVISIFLGVIVGFQSAGVWSVSGKVSTEGKAIQPSSADPNTLKGWMTLEQVVATYNVPLEVLISHFNLPAATAPTTAIKDLESETFDTTALKEWLLERMNAGSAPGIEAEPTISPALKETATAQPDSELNQLPATNILESTQVPTEHAAPVRTVTGKTTIQDLLDWGVSIEAIQNILGGDRPTNTSVIKDIVASKGLDFPTIKAKLQAEIDS
jgi:hypothetical protein